MSERTFAIIKPDAVKAGSTGKILARIEEAGFTIRGMRLQHLSKKEAEGFYAVGYNDNRPSSAQYPVYLKKGDKTELMIDGKHMEYTGKQTSENTVLAS